MPQMYDVQLTLPPIPANEPDVIVTRRVRVSIDGGAFVSYDLPAATATYTVRAAENAVIDVTHALVDDAGLEGPESPVSRLTVLDTVPPVVTGAVVIGTPVPVVPASPPPPPPPPPAGRQLLDPSNIRYRGYYEQFAYDANNGAGLTHRYVNGELRLMFLNFAGNQTTPRYRLEEFTLPAAFGGSCAPVPGRTWSDIWQGNYPGNDTHNGIWFDQDTGKFWHSGTYDYPGSDGFFSVNSVACITSRTLNDDGAIANYAGAYGMAGVGARAIQGGIRGVVPQWFQTANNVGRFVAGFGGYSSRMAQGLTPSMGPFLAFLQEPSGPGRSFGDTVPTISTSGYKIGADCRSGAASASDQYGTPFSLRTVDRGVRVTPIVNYLDGGDPRQNPPTPPSVPPAAGAQWLSPRPDDPRGFGRMVWGDGYFDTFNWIDNAAGTRSRHGILMVASVCSGRVWYQSSSLASDGRAFELHIFDPVHVAECIAGTRQPFDVRPTHCIPLDLPNMGMPSINEFGSVVGATFDPTTNRLYLLGTGCNNNGWWSNRVYAFDID